jgi:hypothetical protein
MGTWVTRLSDDHGVTALALSAHTPADFVDELFQHVLTRRPNAAEKAKYEAYLAHGFAERIQAQPTRPVALPASPNITSPGLNHLNDLATTVRMQQEAAARKGDPATARLTDDWRRRAEDVVWALVDSLNSSTTDPMDRRSFVTALGLAPFAASPLLANAGAAGAAGPKGKAEHCIFIWLGGGMGQADTFDPKALGDNKATKKKPGSLYPSIETSVPGVRLCEHLPRTAKLMEHVTAVRSVNHKVIDEHAFATNLVHTGRMISGNAVYPSIGSIVAHRRGAADSVRPGLHAHRLPERQPRSGLPRHQGRLHLPRRHRDRPERLPRRRPKSRPNVRTPAWRCSKPSANAPPAVRPSRIRGRSARRPSAWPDLRSCATSTSSRSRPPCALPTAANSASAACSRRRLVQGGVRFVEVSHNLNFINGAGWDVHNDGIDNQHVLIRELDHALAGLIEDLKRTGMLDKTLVVIGTEFGRPPEFDGKGGRGHQGTAFSMILAGGGLKHCGAYGETDGLSKTVVKQSSASRTSTPPSSPP